MWQEDVSNTNWSATGTQGGMPEIPKALKRDENNKAPFMGAKA